MAIAVSFSETIILAVASAPTFQLIILLLVTLWVEEDLAAATSHSAVILLPIIPIMVLKTNLRPMGNELAMYPPTQPPPNQKTAGLLG
jgi:hypothetical protein